ncbi:MAG: hypothetical protein GXO90_10670 [FCB group bacterium]|nr:hypothetical protein [FCB group bacterium]
MTTLNKIKQNLICTCECGMTVDACQGAMTCSMSNQLTEEARTQLELTNNKDEVLEYFVSKYGEAILAAPTKSGFNLLAWVMPFLVLIGAGGGVIHLLKKWSAPSASKPRKVKTKSTQPSDKEFTRELDDLLDRMD